MASARIDSRSLLLRDGVWVDQAFRPGMTVVQVKYLSPAYFSLLAHEPRLKKVFSLGRRLLLVLPSGKAVQIDEDGWERLDPEQLRALFPRS